MVFLNKIYYDRSAPELLQSGQAIKKNKKTQIWKKFSLSMWRFVILMFSYFQSSGCIILLIQGLKVTVSALHHLQLHYVYYKEQKVSYSEEHCCYTGGLRSSTLPLITTLITIINNN